uniref:fimbria/pilus outer membrane usher protein n=1 Tax=Klebsiella michiganensis TaxID=1134687 RepID=UPI001D17E6AE
KITKLTTYRLPPRWMFLKIETDEGVVGWGEPVIEGRARTVEADGSEQNLIVPYASLPVLQREGRLKYSMTSGVYRAYDNSID